MHDKASAYDLGYKDGYAGEWDRNSFDYNTERDLYISYENGYDAGMADYERDQMEAHGLVEEFYD